LKDLASAIGEETKVND